MVEIRVSSPIVNVERTGDYVKFSGKTQAKDFKGWLSGKIGLFAKRDNTEMLFIFQEILRAYNHYEKDTDKEIIIEIEGWKGEGNIDIYKGFTDNFVVIEHIKDKETGKVEDRRSEVSKVQVNTLLFWIKKWEVGESHSCYEFAEFLGFKDWKSLWAERKLYFALYYYPMKVLEAIGAINYGGRGKVTRIR